MDDLPSGNDYYISIENMAIEIVSFSIMVIFRFAILNFQRVRVDIILYRSFFVRNSYKIFHILRDDPKISRCESGFLPWLLHQAWITAPGEELNLNADTFEAETCGEKRRFAGEVGEFCATDMF